MEVTVFLSDVCSVHCLWRKIIDSWGKKLKLFQSHYYKLKLCRSQKLNCGCIKINFILSIVKMVLNNLKKLELWGLLESQLKIETSLFIFFFCILGLISNFNSTVRHFSPSRLETFFSLYRTVQFLSGFFNDMWSPVTLHLDVLGMQSLLLSFAVEYLW